MHARHARALALIIGAVALASAWSFAAWVTRAAPTASATTTAAAPGDASRGAALFVAVGCADCHAFRGVGRGIPLDDAASRDDRQALVDWMTGAPAVADALSRRAREAKRRYAALPRADRDALVELLYRGKT